MKHVKGTSGADAYSAGKRNRRLRAKERFEAQLVSKVKNTKDGPVPLDEADIKRINKEIDIIKSRL